MTRQHGVAVRANQIVSFRVQSDDCQQLRRPLLLQQNTHVVYCVRSSLHNEYSPILGFLGAMFSNDNVMVVAVTAVIGLLSIFFLKLYSARSYFKRLEKQGLVRKTY